MKWNFVRLQVKTRVAGGVHALTIRDVNLSEAGEVKLTAKDFQTQAQLTVKGWIRSAHSNAETDHFFS